MSLTTQDCRPLMAPTHVARTDSLLEPSAAKLIKDLKHGLVHSRKRMLGYLSAVVVLTAYLTLSWFLDSLGWVESSAWMVWFTGALYVFNMALFLYLLGLVLLHVRVEYLIRALERVLCEDN